MIEVEKNFDLRPGDKKRLIENAKFIKRKSFTDVYFEDYKNIGSSRRVYEIPKHDARSRYRPLKLLPAPARIGHKWVTVVDHDYDDKERNI